MAFNWCKWSSRTWIGCLGYLWTGDWLEWR